MKCFSWREEDSKQLGKVLRPVVEIAVKDKDKNWKFLNVYVDSGADISVFKRSFGELLGINIERGKYVEFGGAGGGKVKVYLHEIELKIEDDVLKAKVGFCKEHNANVPNILGRLDIFDSFEIWFKNLNKETCFVKTRE